VDELQELGCELHFEIDPDQRVFVQVRDPNGCVLRTIPPSEALEILSGRSPRTRTAHMPDPPNRNLP